MLTHFTRGASCGISDLNSSLPVVTQTDLISSDPKAPTARFNDQTWTQVFFQNPQILRIIASDVNHPLNSLQLHFLSGSLLWQIMIVISFPHARKTAPSDYAPELRDNE